MRGRRAHPLRKGGPAHTSLVRAPLIEGPGGASSEKARMEADHVWAGTRLPHVGWWAGPCVAGARMEDGPLGKRSCLCFRSLRPFEVLEFLLLAFGLVGRLFCQDVAFAFNGFLT